MQSKAVRAIPDVKRYCIACGYEPSPNGGKGDDLRLYEGGHLYHPICYDEVEEYIAEFNRIGASPEKAKEVFEFLGLNTDLLTLNGKPIK